MTIDLSREKPISMMDVAKRLGVTRKTVYGWARGVTGRALETVKAGGKRLTTEEALQRFVKPPSHETLAM